MAKQPGIKVVTLPLFFTFLLVKTMGHSSVAFTMDVYSHIIERMQSDAMVLPNI
ncbi:MAG: hypothetical protein HW402_1063 [Dehalococcoidales bacterium]|nr:hypothetical protein [Dehalococcoidales bacterium]